MNLQNVKDLSEKLNHFGIENAAVWLGRRISFKLQHFTLNKLIQKGSTKAVFQLYFERSTSTDAYELKYYDAVLYRELPVSETIINGISPKELDKRMSQINWRELFMEETAFAYTADDKVAWAEVQAVDAIVTDLLELERGEGKDIATFLKQKHWTGISYSEFSQKTIASKVKPEISQRFYCQPHGDIISTDEAFRFLENSKLEREIKANKKLDRDTDPQLSEGGQTNKRKAKRTSGRKSK